MRVSIGPRLSCPPRIRPAFQGSTWHQWCCGAKGEAACVTHVVPWARKARRGPGQAIRCERVTHLPHRRPSATNKYNWRCCSLIFSRGMRVPASRRTIFRCLLCDTKPPHPHAKPPPPLEPRQRAALSIAGKRPRRRGAARPGRPRCQILTHYLTGAAAAPPHYSLPSLTHPLPGGGL
jgi:hypothetical protein